MAFYHGVRTGEIATSVVPAVKADQPAVVIGTAPVHLSSDGRGVVNRPVLCYSLAEAQAALGYSDDWDSYTLCEAMHAFFSLYAAAPVVFINVLDPKKHKKTRSDETVKLENGSASLGKNIIASTVAAEGYERSSDYTLSWDGEELILTRMPGGSLSADAELTMSWDEIDPSAVTAEDIIGGYNVPTGTYSGLEVIEQVYPVTGLVPCFLIAPKWSENSEVAAVMGAKCSSVNGVFPCLYGVDLPLSEVRSYSVALEWKNRNGLDDEACVVFWPMVKLGGRVYHQSVHFAALKLKTDAQNDGIPYKSPSNESYQIDGACTGSADEDSEVNLTLNQANYLNSQGIVTALKFPGSWKCWGNWTACYPSVTDSKDAFIAVKAMFYWERVHLVQSYWQKVDNPTNRRLIQTLVDSENIFLNGLAARGVLVGDGNRVSFREEDNPDTELLAGTIRLHVDMTPCIPAAVIDYNLEFNVDNLKSLFS